MHVRDAELRLDAAVNELDHRMHHAFWMNDDLDGRVGDIEEEMRLDDLETLVHHRGGAALDLGPHFPARMRQRPTNLPAGEPPARTPKERTTRPGRAHPPAGPL